MLLDHCIHFFDLNGDVLAEQWLSFILEGKNWYPETIALLLYRQGKGGLPIQNLHGCLHQAIGGSFAGSEHEIKETLILLVKGGADVYARDDLGHTVSQMACCRKTRWYNNSWLHIEFYDGTVNRDLRLKGIWMDVLSVCGYDSEGVISASVRLEQPCNCDLDSLFGSYGHICTAPFSHSEGDNDSMSDEEGESDVFADVDNDSTSDEVGESDVAADDVITRQPDAVLSHHYENILLEGDAEVWSS